MNSNKTSFAFKNWILWTFLGWVLGVIFILSLSGILDWFGIEGYQFYLGFGMATGVGIGQWFALRKTIPVSRLWVVFAALGMGIPFIILDLLPAMPYKLAINIVLGSLTSGFLQWLLLKKYAAKAFFWIPVSIAAWCLAVAASFLVNFTMMIKVAGFMNLVLALINLFLLLSGGIVLGLITSLVIKKITVTN